MALSKKFTFSNKLRTAVHYPFRRMAGYPTLINLEVTKKCNARCDFCDYWKTETETRLDDYAPVIAKLRPTVVMLTGGEPLLRRDLEQVIAGIKAQAPDVYLGLITHGAMLNPKRGLSLWNAGLDQLSISLDFLDERHDSARGIPGLVAKLFDNIPLLVEAGIDSLALNTVIKQDNLDQIVAMVHQCERWGIKISFSAYADVKVGNKDHNVAGEQMAQLERVIAQLIELKERGKPILSSTYYLKRIPEFFSSGHIGGCVSGDKFVTVTPSGHVKRCSEFEPDVHYTEWTPKSIGNTDCDVCWFSCRGESQAPAISIERLKDTLPA
jgi:MoaA/NifB/PqqE/SkfB family radical SAM enzyme